jgi:hypothetical protein
MSPDSFVPVLSVNYGHKYTSAAGLVNGDDHRTTTLMTPMHFGPVVEQLSNDLKLLSEQALAYTYRHGLKRKFDFEKNQALLSIANQLEEKTVPQTPAAFRHSELLLSPLQLALPFETTAEQ